MAATAWHSGALTWEPTRAPGGAGCCAGSCCSRAGAIAITTGSGVRGRQPPEQWIGEGGPMNIAFCHESVLPERGGCETYIADLARRLIADRHEVHLYACRWDERALPAGLRCHALPAPRGPRFLRPWRFGRACLRALAEGGHDLSVGFAKTWGQDV